MSTDVAYHRRPVVRDFHSDFEPDGLPALRCATCGKTFLRRYTFERNCANCADSDSGMRSSSRPESATLDDVRRGKWTPTPELAATLAYRGEEISACPSCGHVRLRLVGQACGGTGCKKQGELFGGVA